jgi:hypothetical protein
VLLLLPLLPLRLPLGLLLAAFVSTCLLLLSLEQVCAAAAS